jgi:hypothetical protein
MGRLPQAVAATTLMPGVRPKEKTSARLGLPKGLRLIIGGGGEVKYLLPGWETKMGCRGDAVYL